MANCLFGDDKLTDRRSLTAFAGVSAAMASGSLAPSQFIDGKMELERKCNLRNVS